MRKRRERPEIQAQEAAEHKRYRERIATMPKTDEERAVEKEYFKRYHAEHKKARRIKELKKRYGLTYEEYVGMIESQGGRCAICKTTDWGKKEPHVDHDHGTGLVRGILCNRCNAAAGMLLDDPARAMLLADYLTRCARV